jgi:hypothetical protein
LNDFQTKIQPKLKLFGKVLHRYFENVKTQK